MIPFPCRVGNSDAAGLRLIPGPDDGRDLLQRVATVGPTPSVVWQSVLLAEWRERLAAKRWLWPAAGDLPQRPYWLNQAAHEFLERQEQAKRQRRAKRRKVRERRARRLMRDLLPLFAEWLAAELPGALETLLRQRRAATNGQAEATAESR